MAMEKITENGVAIALVTGTCALTDEQTALDLIMEARTCLLQGRWRLRFL